MEIPTKRKVIEDGTGILRGGITDIIWGTEIENVDAFLNLKIENLPEGTISVKRVLRKKACAVAFVETDNRVTEHMLMVTENGLKLCDIIESITSK